jgi:hypothetical protein
VLVRHRARLGVAAANVLCRLRRRKLLAGAIRDLDVEQVAAILDRVLRPVQDALGGHPLDQALEVGPRQVVAPARGPAARIHERERGRERETDTPPLSSTVSRAREQRVPGTHASSEPIVSARGLIYPRETSKGEDSCGDARARGAKGARDGGPSMPRAHRRARARAATARSATREAAREGQSDTWASRTTDHTSPSALSQAVSMDSVSVERRPFAPAPSRVRAVDCRSALLPQGA